MIQSNKSLYHEINSIMDILKLSGNDAFAKKLEDALTISTVTSEVLGELRLALESLDSTKIPDQLGIKSNVVDALLYLNKVM